MASFLGSQAPLTISLVATKDHNNLREDHRSNFNNNNSSSNNNNHSNNNNSSSSPNLNHFSPSNNNNSSGRDQPKEASSKHQYSDPSLPSSPK